MIVALTYGTFDTFHYGHWSLLHRASQLSDILIVGVSTDEFNKQKGKTSLFDYNYRKQIITSLHFVALVIPENSWKQKENDIKRFKANKLIMGDDWLGKFDGYNSLLEVVYLPRTENISSTLIRGLNEGLK